MHFSIIFLITISMKPVFTESAKILGIFPQQSKSHHSFHQPILQGLAARGHEVTIISHFKSKSTIQNYTEIQLKEGLQSFVDSFSIEDTTNQFVGVFDIIKSGVETIEKPLCLKILNSDYIQNLLNSEAKIDLLFVEVYCMRCYFLLAHKLNIPVILVSPLSAMMSIDDFLGNPYNPSYLPLIINPFSTKMNFFQRLQNSFLYAILYWYHVYEFPKHTKQIAQECLHMDETPSDDVLYKTVALGFYNNHWSFISRPKSPNVIDIAGIHIGKAKNLSKDIKEFIEESAHGVIFFSFGTTIKASTMSPEKLDIIREVFSSILQRVLWRVDQLNITDLPSNVKLAKWFPQRDILEHKNVIAFISHCGLLGTQEAIHTATPIIGMPFWFDQMQNAKILVEKGVGTYVDYHTMDKQTLLAAINKITLDKSYLQNMQKLSQIFKDRPRSPLDEAIYWSEYVIKFQGAPHLRTYGADMPLYQYLLLDVVAFVVIVITSAFFICKYVLKKFLNCIFRPSQEKQKVS